MSAEANPITPARFAAALRDLTLSSLHAKAAELRNSIAHLQRSNAELQPLAADGDEDCAEAIWENLQVIKRMDERIELLRAEVENRGFLWDVSEKGELQPGQLSPPEEEIASASQTTEQDTGIMAARQGVRQGGSLNDEELARRLAEQMDQDGEDGVHL